MHNLRIAIPGTYNFRDIGGYPGRNGRRVADGRFFRADQLNALDAAGRNAVKQLGVASIIDLRTAKECHDAPNPFAGDSSIAYHWFDMVGDSDDIISRGDTIETARRDARLPNGYFADPVGRIAAIYITILDHQQPMIRRILSTLATAPTAVLFHCVAGQDRTGMIAALLLSIAEVDASTIVEDYAGTATHNVVRYQKENHRLYWQMDIQTAAQYGSQFCPAGAMERTLQHFRDRYGDAVGYVKGLGVTDAELALLRQRLLGADTTGG